MKKSQTFGSLIIDIEGKILTAVEKNILQHKHVGGVLLFKKNYQDRSQLKNLITEIRINVDKPLLITVDHEGGRIWRFHDGFTKIPAARHFGILYEHDRELAKQQAHNAGHIIGYELLNCGVDLTLAPVLDIGGKNDVVIGDRAWHTNKQIIIELAQSFINGLASVGMSAVGKHFPGHGGCNIDTHTNIAEDHRSFIDMETDLYPFLHLANILSAVMPAHVIYPKIDPAPASCSKIWLQDILRNKLNFKGAVISDCMSMAGANNQGNMLSRVHSALHAGCDLVIVSQQSRDDLLNLLNSIQWETSKEQQARIANLTGNFQHKALSQPKPQLAEFCEFPLAQEEKECRINL